MEVKSHKPGSFSWTDLATTDPAAAKKFYGEVFGWTADDQPMPPGQASYALEKIKGKSVAGISGMMEEQKKAGMPPHWTAYFTVQNVDEATKKATSLGGKALMPPMDVMDVGRMAVIEDPAGAPFAIWQPKKHIGAELLQEPGTICWSELESRNVDQSGGFYSKFFGWSSKTQDMGGGKKYTVFTDGNDQRAGLMASDPKSPPNVPSHWNVYFLVDNADATAKKAASLNAKTLVPPTDIPDVGRFAMFFDPQGAMFCVLQAAPRK